MFLVCLKVFRLYDEINASLNVKYDQILMFDEKNVSFQVYNWKLSKTEANLTVQKITLR